MPPRSTNNLTKHQHEYMHRTNQKIPYVTETAHVLLERAKSNLVDASTVLPDHFWHWTLIAERNCPCAEKTHDASSLCTFCFGTGKLPGYVKKGFKTELLHENSPWNMVNMYWDYRLNSLVPLMTLEDTALLGYAESNWVAISSCIWLEGIYPLVNEEGDIKYLVTFDDVTWYEHDDKKVSELFNNASKVKFRVVIKRNTLDSEIPKIAGIKFRYKVSPEAEIMGDIPKFRQDIERDELGILWGMDSYNLAMTYRVGDIKIGDFFEYVRKNDAGIYVPMKPTRRFKLQNNEPLAPQGNAMFIDTLVRLIQPDEPFARIH